MLNEKTGLLLFLGYAVFMIALVWFTKRRNETSEDFLLMDRKLGTLHGSFSMAVSWIWAPAIFISSMIAYEKGLPGIFWFTVPNILTFFVFAILAVQLRKKFDNGYTISDIFRQRFGDKYTHYASLIVAFGYQLGAIIINAVAGATLINLLSGIDYFWGVMMMGGLALIYSLISGLRASVMSDVAQMSILIIMALIIVPFSVSETGGLSALVNGLGGKTGEFTNIFDPSIAYAFGIATAIGLLSGPIADQMFTQRAFAAKKESLVKIFIYGGLIFGIIPIILSILGFLGASLELNETIKIADPQMVGPEVIAHLLPAWALGLFALMAFAGLTSTLDSAFTAIGSLSAIDVKSENNTNRLKRARLGMIIFAIIGMSIALLQPKLLWVFLIYGALASSLFFPAFLLAFWNRLTAKGAFWGIVAGLTLGTPLSVYANVMENTDLIVLSAILSLIIAGIISILVSLKR